MGWLRTETTDPASREYDVALSFAGEQRDYVERVALRLRALGVRVFYDDYEKVNLWGKDLYEHLAWIYGKAARYCVLFASVEYAQKVWTSHERRSAQERALTEHVEYILPVRFDETEIPGLRSTIGYLDARKVDSEELGTLIRSKLGPVRRDKYVPPEPDRLFRALEVDSRAERERIRRVADSFVQTLSRATNDERYLVAYVLYMSCPEGLYSAPHVNLDLLRRDTGVTQAEVVEVFRGLRSLGFRAEVKQHSSEDARDEVVYLNWNDNSVYRDVAVELYAHENSTRIATAMIQNALEHYCEGCCARVLERLDFSALSSTRPEAAGHSMPAP